MSTNFKNILERAPGSRTPANPTPNPSQVDFNLPVVIAQRGPKGLNLGSLQSAWKKLGYSNETIRKIEFEVSSRPSLGLLGYDATVRLTPKENDAANRQLRKYLAPELPKSAAHCTLYVNYLLIQDGNAPLGYPGGPGYPVRNYSSVRAAYQNLREIGAKRVPLDQIKPGDVVVFLQASEVEHLYLAVHWNGKTLLNGMSGSQAQIRDPKSDFLKYIEEIGALKIFRLR